MGVVGLLLEAAAVEGDGQDDVVSDSDDRWNNLGSEAEWALLQAVSKAPQAFFEALVQKMVAYGVRVHEWKG
ncbi:hypothetical protein Micbo1qcDRAFT_167096, partial [Microdochium bolleyi]